MLPGGGHDPALTITAQETAWRRTYVLVQFTKTAEGSDGEVSGYVGPGVRRPKVLRRYCGDGASHRKKQARTVESTHAIPWIIVDDHKKNSFHTNIYHTRERPVGNAESPTDIEKFPTYLIEPITRLRNLVEEDARTTGGESEVAWDG